jgi:hypothetical protein
MFEHEEILLWVLLASAPWEGERIKVVGEEMQYVLFKSWIKRNPKE